MSDQEHDHDCHKNRVARQGLIISEIALSMTRGIRCLGADMTEEEVTEALDYVVDAIVHIALRDKDPRLVIEKIITKFDDYPIEELMRLIAQHRPG